MASIPHVRLIDRVTGNEAEVTADGDVQTTPTGRAASGATVAGNPLLAGLRDTGNNAQFLQGDTAGNLFIAGPDADGAAASANPVQIGGVDGSSNVQAVSTDASGNVNVNIVSGAGGTPIEHEVDAPVPAGQSIAAGASFDFDTADLDGQDHTLVQVTVAGTQAWTARVYTVEDGTEDQLTAPIAGAAGETVIWDIPSGAVALTGGNVGLDAFRVEITNQDNNSSGVFAVNIFYFSE